MTSFFFLTKSILQISSHITKQFQAHSSRQNAWGHAMNGNSSSILNGREHVVSKSNQYIESYVESHSQVQIQVTGCGTAAPVCSTTAHAVRPSSHESKFWFKFIKSPSYSFILPLGNQIHHKEPHIARSRWIRVVPSQMRIEEGRRATTWAKSSRSHRRRWKMAGNHRSTARV
jgi:hypothetical protein